MKILQSIFVLFLLAVLPTARAQNGLPTGEPDTFRIQNFPLRFWYDGEKISKPRKIEAILLPPNDPQINRDWQNGKTIRNIGLGIQIVGLGVMTAGFLKTIQGEEDDNNLLLTGAGVMLGGVVIQIAGTGPVKRSMRRYNDLQMRRVDPPIPTVLKPDPLAGSDSLIPLKRPAGRAVAPPPKASVGLFVGINNSKLWEIGGSEELRTQDQIWWAKSVPLTIRYEIPGKRPGDVLRFELALLSKGLRIKTEETGSSGSVRARSDFQMRFAQLSSLKTLPIGRQDGPLRFSAHGGAFVSYAATARFKTRAVSKDEDTKTWTRSIHKAEFGDEFGEINSKRFDAGLALGAGATWPLGPGRIGFEARFSVGLINLENGKSPFPDYELPSLHTRDLTFLLGYAIPVR